MNPKPNPIPVRLTNRWAVFDCSPEIQSRVKETFRYEHPQRDFIESYRCGQWDGFVNLFQRGRVSTGLFLARRKELEEDLPVRIIDLRINPTFREYKDPQAWKNQNDGVEAMIKASNCGGLILSATGSGKTRLAGVYFKRLRGTAVFIVDELTLLEQSRRALSKVIGEEVGVVGRSEFNPKRITVATIQTLHRHKDKPAFKKWFSRLDVLIIDEVHLALNRRNIDVVKSVKPKAVFGLTATLEVLKPHVLMEAQALTGPVIYEYPIQDGVADGHLTPGKICNVMFYDPLRGLAPGYWSDEENTIWIDAGTPAAEYRYHICMNRPRNDVIELLVRHGLKLKRRIIVLVEHRVHLRVLARRFAHVRHVVLSGEVDAEERIEAMHEMDAGKLSLILASRVFAKGVDVSAVDMIIDATGMPSRNNAIQRYGRGVRKAEGKDVLWYFNISDRNSKFGSTARAREKALRETGMPIVQVEWGGEAEDVFDALQPQTPRWKSRLI